jgi:hypothetical protein
MHLSLKGSLKSSLVFTYVKTDQALDLGNLEPFTIPDLSGNANTATLYSGIYVSTNGTTDKAIGANATALGSGNYYLSGKIKPAGTTAKTTMNGSTASNLTGLTAGVWQDFQTATASAITPSSINLGWDGTAFNATVDNWSDVKLHDASDDSVVAHWKLYDSADASLGGYPVLDCVGGFHGAHVGCAGGASEASILQTAGEDFNKLIYAKATNVGVQLGASETLSGDFKIRANICIFSITADATIWGGATGTKIDIDTSLSSIEFRGPTSFQIALDSALLLKTPYEITITRTSGVVSVHVNGVEQSATATNSTNLNYQYFGYQFNRLNEGLNGLIWDCYQSDNADENWSHHWRLYGRNDTIDRIGANDGTATNSPPELLIPTSNTIPTNDALGNAIENPRPNERVLNLTTGTGYAEVADSASLDLTTEATWEIWGNFADKQTNNQEAYLAKYNAGGNKRSWNIAYNPVNQNPDEISMAFGDPSDGTFEGLVKISVPNEIASVVFTYNNGTLVAYVNGSSVGKTVVAGSVPVTLHQNNEPVLVGSSGDDLPAATLIGDIRIYDRALTADEVLKNYNARKGAYGL